MNFSRRKTGYQLLAERRMNCGGRGNQDLINILDSLPEKDQGPMGFKVGQNY